MKVPFQVNKAAIALPPLDEEDPLDTIQDSEVWKAGCGVS